MQFYVKLPNNKFFQIKTKIGKVPWKWYDNYKHFGYDSELNKIQKEKQGIFFHKIINIHTYKYLFIYFI